MYRRMLQAAAVGLAIAATSSVAQAQNILTQGLSLGLDVSYANVTLKDDDIGLDESEGGIGFGFRAGYGLNGMWQPYVGYSRNTFEVQDVDATLNSIDIGTRVNLPLAGRSWVPFADVAYNIRSATLEDGVSPDLEMDGSTFTLGGGVQWFMNSQWSIDGGLQYQLGKFDEGEQGGASGDLDVDANTLRLNVGFSWRPMSR